MIKFSTPLSLPSNIEGFTSVVPCDDQTHLACVKKRRNPFDLRREFFHSLPLQKRLSRSRGELHEGFPFLAAPPPLLNLSNHSGGGHEGDSLLSSLKYLHGPPFSPLFFHVLVSTLIVCVSLRECIECWSNKQVIRWADRIS